ncbi:unnamed protein product, partial [Closterium sp. NIES-53]
HVVSGVCAAARPPLADSGPRDPRILAAHLPVLSRQVERDEGPRIRQVHQEGPLGAVGLHAPRDRRRAHRFHCDACGGCAAE